MTTANILSQLGSAGVSTAFKNRIINGNMVIDQRNAGASVTPTFDGQYTLDRYQISLSQSSKFSVQQVSTAPTGFTNSLKVTSLSAYSVASSDYFMVNQVIEGFNIADLGWGTASAKTVTLSFQVYSSLTGTFGGSINNNGSSRSYPFSYTISSANTWTTISVTIAGDTTGTWLTTNGQGLLVRFGLGVGSTYSGTAGAWASGGYFSATGATSVVGTNGATFYITGVQLEVGTTATNFDYRPYGTELALCQRYYEKSYDQSTTPGTTTDNVVGGTGVATSTTSIVASVAYKIPKRITGNTVTIYAYDGTSGSVSGYDATGNSGATGATYNKVGEFGYTGIKKTGGTNFTASAYYWWQWTSSAEL